MFTVKRTEIGNFWGYIHTEKLSGLGINKKKTLYRIRFKQNKLNLLLRDKTSHPYSKHGRPGYDIKLKKKCSAKGAFVV